MFRNLGKKPQKEPWGGTNLAHQVILQLINPTFPWGWEYYWVTFSLMDKLFLNTLQDKNKLLWMNPSKRTVLSSKSSEIAKSKQPPLQVGHHTNKNIPKIPLPLISSPFAFTMLLYKSTPPTSTMGKSYYIATFKGFQILLDAYLPSTNIFWIRRENSTSNPLKIKFCL